MCEIKKIKKFSINVYVLAEGYGEVLWAYTKVKMEKGWELGFFFMYSPTRYSYVFILLLNHVYESTKY